MPADAEFCLITFTLLPSPFLNATSLAQRNAAKWTYEPKAFGATTFVAPRLARSNSWYHGPGSAPLDVTENIYIGARPGNNRQVFWGTTAHTDYTHTCTCSTSYMHIATLVTLTSVTAQDKMVPFDQLGIEYSPAYFFNASTASYAPSDV